MSASMVVFDVSNASQHESSVDLVSCTVLSLGQVEVGQVEVILFAPDWHWAIRRRSEKAHDG